ncbi:MAG: rhomboid family intramembrane serine protease [Bacteroidetes bacterium]|nr:MAG: rhomboid family intramembrane serine protease [Bacteroidota bacterium]
MSRFFTTFSNNTPPVTKNLIILNVGMWFILILALQFFNIDLNRILGLYSMQSPFFYPFQIVTHMFMHSNRIFHVFINMWVLWMFGRTLEGVWGSKRFLIYYLATGLGAAFFHLLVNQLMHGADIAALKAMAGGPISTELLQQILSNPQNDFYEGALSLLIPTVGASGAVYGLLLAFGMLFPNTPLMIFPIPIPIKAKWMVIGTGVISIYLGLADRGGNIAHFAHLGGMIFGFILIKYWNKFTKNFF